MKKCVIIGNGPSLRDIDFSKIKEVDTFSFNRAYISYEDEWKFFPTYYAVIDGNTIRSTVDDIKKLHHQDNGIKKIFVNNCKNEFDFSDCNTDKFVQIKHFSGSLHDKHIGDMVGKDDMVNKLCLYTNICTYAVQLAYMLGYDTVGMIGVDAKYVVRKDVKKVGVYESGPLKGKPKVVFTDDKDPNHYRSDYHGKNHQTSADHLHGVSGNDLSPWRSLKSVLVGKPKFKLYSCTKGSKLNGEFFEYKPIDDFLNL